MPLHGLPRPADSLVSRHPLPLAHLHALQEELNLVVELKSGRVPVLLAMGERSQADRVQVRWNRLGDHLRSRGDLPVTARGLVRSAGSFDNE